MLPANLQLKKEEETSKKESEGAPEETATVVPVEEEEEEEKSTDLSSSIDLLVQYLAELEPEGAVSLIFKEVF